ncbi:MAG TPA: LuxR C-terminal-related transcriptional regulator [Gemmatimonadaceae bacterium]|nr:LuxR C-terminal-related transcriptional regulator [Gemmatimonadaceae bacterium]
MQSDRLGRTLALGIIAVAAFSTLASISLPVRARKPDALTVALVLILLLAHAAAYWFGSSIRARFGIARYVALQAVLIFGIAFFGELFPLGLGLYIAMTAQTIILAEKQWGSIVITLGAIVLFAINAMAARDLYQGATAGLLLAVTGIVSHAIVALVNRKPRAVTSDQVPEPSVVNNGTTNLTAREIEVLRLTVTGARSSQIASSLGISERTVKAHLANIYQKLGVESRAAAVAIAVQKGIV